MKPAKPSKVHIESGDKPYTTQVYLDGKEITNLLTQISFEAGDSGRPRLLLEYNCFDQLTIDGEVDVHHNCPKGGRK